MSESASKGTPLLTVQAKDPDIISRPKYSLIGPGASIFSIESDSGKLYVQNSLDREKQSEFLLKVEAREPHRQKWKCSSRVRILITDVNDNPPKFETPHYVISVPENSPHHSLALLHAADPDEGKLSE